jgi:hypothetical protein
MSVASPWANLMWVASTKQVLRRLPPGGAEGEDGEGELKTLGGLAGCRMDPTHSGEVTRKGGDAIARSNRLKPRHRAGHHGEFPRFT